MFESILIRPNAARSHPLDFGQVIENLFFYGQTIVHIGRGEIPALYDLAEVEVLEQLLRLPYLSLYFNNSLSGLASHGDIHSVQTLGLLDLDVERELYTEALSYKGDKTKSRKFAKKLSRLIPVYQLPDSYLKTAQEQIKDTVFLQGVFQEVLRRTNPHLPNPQDFRYELEFLDAVNFRIHTNIQDSHPDPSLIDSPALALINGVEDLYVMSDYASEISLPEYNAAIVRIKAQEVLKKHTNSKREIEVFHHFVFDESWALREAINSKRIHVKAILKVLDKGAKYKEWLHGLKADANVMQEYVAKVEEKNILEQLPLRAIRFYLFSGLPQILAALNPEAAIPLSVALSAFDSFLLDKLSKDWKPNQFIERELRPLVTKGMY